MDINQNDILAFLKGQGDAFDRILPGGRFEKPVV